MSAVSPGLLPDLSAQAATELLSSVAAISLTGLVLYTPVYDAAGEISDFAFAYLNPAARRLLRLPANHAGTYLAQFPAGRHNGELALHRAAFLSGEASTFELTYRAATTGDDQAFCAAGCRTGAYLLVSFGAPTGHSASTVAAAQGTQATERPAADTQHPRLYQALMQLPASVAILHGADHVFTLVSPGYQQLFPVRPLLGRPVLEALPELASQPHLTLLRGVYQTGQPYYGTEVETWVDFANTGQPQLRYFNVFFQALRDDRGTIEGVLNFAYDVTEQVLGRQQLWRLNQELETRVQERTQALQRAQAEAERQGQRLRHLLLEVPAAICILGGPELVFELVNPGYQAFFPGRPLQGLPILVALPELADHTAYHTMRRVYETGITHEERGSHMAIARPADGVFEDRYFNYTQQARRDEHGQVDGVLAFVFEVTEQVRARHAAESGTQRLRLLTDALPVLISYIDDQQRYQFVNRAYEAWFHLPASEIVGMAPAQVVGAAAYQQVRGYMERALAGELIDYEVRMNYAHGLNKHVHGTFVPDVRAGRVVGFFTLVTDITAQVEAREALEASVQQARTLADELSQANQQLTSTNVDLDTFIYTASHDLKAPISNIEGLLTTLRGELPALDAASDVPQIMDLMEESVERFKTTIGHLTEVSKLQKAHGQPASQVPLAPVIVGVRLDLAPLLLQTGGHLDVEVREVPMVVFSAKNLRSVVYNLLSNALKYHHPDRAPEVRVRARLEPNYAVLEVSDNGLGLDPRRTSQVFVMFQRLHTHVEGSGVGLYMVKRMVENAGGKITVQSQLGVGSTFTVFFKR